MEQFAGDRQGRSHRKQLKAPVQAPPGDRGSARHDGQLGRQGDHALQSQNILIGVPVDQQGSSHKQTN